MCEVKNREFLNKRISNIKYPDHAEIQPPLPNYDEIFFVNKTLILIKSLIESFDI